MFKKEKGVTLVALIITIIVLLILAGIAFSTLLTNNGLLNRARGAGNTWKGAEENEQIFLNTAAEEYDNLMKDIDPNYVAP